MGSPVGQALIGAEREQRQPRRKKRREDRAKMPQGRIYSEAPLEAAT